MEGRILFSSPVLSEFFKTSNFELNLKTGRVFTYLYAPEDIGIKCQKEPFDLESLMDTTRQTRYRHNTRRETQKNSKCKETSWTGRCNAPRRSRIQGTPILSSLDHVCRQLSRTEKEIRTFTRKCSSSLQNVRTIHL